MREDEAKMLAKAREEIAAEKAAYLALSPADRAAIDAEREAKWDAFADACNEDNDNEE
jgi:hypothetical protein